MLTKDVVFRGAMVVSLVAGAGCSRPPTEEMQGAFAAQEAAVAAEASDYAPDEQALVTRLREELDVEMAAQEEKVALTRSYDRAKVLTDSLLTAADHATQAANGNKARVQEETSGMIALLRTSLEEARGRLAVAPAGKGSAADLAMLRADLDAAGQALTEAQASMDSGRYLDARARATAAQETLAKVTGAVSQARAIRQIS
jgi:hypothetical protein